MTIINEIKQCIESQLDVGNKKFIIFPFGEIGMKVNSILKEIYNIDAEYILDNHLSKYNSKIKPLTFLKEINCNEYTLLLASKNLEIYLDIKDFVKEYFKEENIAELSSMKTVSKKTSSTKAGKYSYGGLCNHWLVESVGAFCSFAIGSDVVQNHPTNYLSTHPFIYFGNENNYAHQKPYAEHNHEPWFFKGVSPKGSVEKLKRIKIGNDVWFGKNVIVTNGANIGNGVIAGAGSIITKDVPDYAVIVGAPARIIRYRYTPEQIEMLNKIQWWNWSDEEIRERYNDLYLPIEEFIEKYKDQ